MPYVHEHELIYRPICATGTLHHNGPEAWSILTRRKPTVVSFQTQPQRVLEVRGGSKLADEYQ